MQGNHALLQSWELSLHDQTARTRDLYRMTLRSFVAWLDAEHPGLDLFSVERRHVEEWFAQMRDTPSAHTGKLVAQATIRSRWIALRNFYGWALEEEEVTASPLAKVKVAKASSPPVRVMTEAELAALLSVCSGTAFPERRDAALIRTLAATGVRVSELCSMKADELDLTNRIAPVWGKGNKPRYVRFDAETAKALDRYLRARARYRTAHLPDLWIGHRGALTRKGVPSILEKRAIQARADGHEVGHIHPHAFRHRFAHQWLANGGTEGDLQRLGGWTSDQVMRRYGSALADDRALAAYDRLAPMKGL